MKKTSWFFRTLSCAIAVVSSSALLVFTPAPVPVSTVLGDAGIGMMSVEAAEVYFKKPSKRYSSIVDALKSIGVDSSYAYREKIAAANGISGYKGTSAQNTRLLDLLYAGKLKKPGSGGGSGNTNQASSMSKIALSVPTIISSFFGQNCPMPWDSNFASEPIPFFILLLSGVFSIGIAVMILRKHRML